MNVAKRKKPFYIPGLISLTLLPIIFIYFGSKKIKEISLTVLPLTLADTNFSKEYREFYKDFKYNVPPKRDYIDMDFTGDNQTDKIKLDFAQIKVREILAQNNSKQGLHFHFNKSSQYWTFVKTVDILRFEKAKTYLPFDRDLWFYNLPPDTTMANWICGTTYDDMVYIKPKLSWWTILTTWAITNIRNSWEIILVFTTFVILTSAIARQKNGR